MARATNTSPKPSSAEGAPQPVALEAPQSDLAANLRRVVKAVEAVDADGYREPPAIATDDAGASQLARELNPPSTDKTLGASRG